MARHIVQEAQEAEGGRRTALAALRNVGPIIEAFTKRLPSQGRVLEVASGTGQHAAAFAAAFPALEWTPSDVDPGQRASICAWRKHSGLMNLTEPLDIDVAAAWPVTQGSVQAVLTINLFHLIPDAFVSRFFEQARAALSDTGLSDTGLSDTGLSDTGRVILYGPFLRGLDYASEGDRGFDASLRARDPAIGYKSVEAVSDVAAAKGFTSIATDEMPANNLLLTFAAA